MTAKSTLKKLETICIKMEVLTPELKDEGLRWKLTQLKSRMIDLLREAEGK